MKERKKDSSLLQCEQCKKYRRVALTSLAVFKMLAQIREVIVPTPNFNYYRMCIPPGRNYLAIMQFTAICAVVSVKTSVEFGSGDLSHV